MYQLVFRGECAQGTDLKTARANAQALFKASLDQVDRMFSGQAVVIRNKLDQAQAEKYRQVLLKHGMVAHVQAMPGSQPAPAAPGQPSQTRPAASEPAPQPQRPTESASAPARRPPQGAGPKVEPGDRLPVAGEKVDSILAGSGLSLDPVGVTLAEPEEVTPPMFQHLDEWTLAPAGSDLGEKRDLPPPMVPDVSHLSLAEDKQN
ncbi:MAG: hypothetical protein R3280_00990 [Marinobacter sp.]|uniref:hypothetical protein n=1 Tax=Marinobacter sp. TaxID=50741 RepID=UPI00299DD539|nr:hypothetical protein [Marinobacter sp.]MDX1633188.1 hypothetical protein [Marinobacter sp.]